MDEQYEVFCGLDVGKSEHHAAALNAAGERVFDKPLPQDEARLRELFTGLQQHGRVLVIVDQPNTIGALPIAVARDCGCTVAYLPGLAMRKAADLYPGKSKTDARDAFIIAETARAMPHMLRAVDRDSEVLAALKVLSGFDADLTHECTSIRGEFPARSGNKQLKNALFRSAWIASCHHAASKAYYQKKRAQGKKHNAAVICLARRRCDVIYSMLRHGTFYEEKPALAA
ncbi:transposase [Arthrobacter sp. OY3WO11]|uniref:IS110 family transposase n=1 Tax=Arthrobacter sp. OY3WO11 TaxID=1835723 RepID=UPI0007D03701|nr:transposase [Arthrobacter sp. OY3WO11]OAD97639.1 hypothetical protein A6A22_19685 [Arthrobacter sp. OY3WO11]